MSVSFPGGEGVPGHRASTSPKEGTEGPERRGRGRTTRSRTLERGLLPVLTKSTVVLSSPVTSPVTLGDPPVDRRTSSRTGGV